MFLIFLRAALGIAPLFLFGSTGETLTEKSGHLNMGIPGIMCVGSAGGALGIVLYDKIVGGVANANGFAVILMAMLFAIIFGALCGLIFSFFTVSLRCNQNVMGLTMTTFGIGFYTLFFNILNSGGLYPQYEKFFTSLFISQADASNWFETIFLSYGPLWYLSFIIAIVIAFVFNRTRTGLSIQAVGESAASADAAGINVSKVRYACTIIGSSIAAIGGLFYLMEMKGGLIEYTELDSFGWIAVALVIFTLWRTDLGMIGAVIFALLYKLPYYYALPNYAANMLFKYLPYLVTVIILIFVSAVNRKLAQAPKDLGVSYFREDR